VRPRALDRSRPLCADEAAARGDPLPGTASRVTAWLLVEYGGRWPYEPLDTSVFVGGLRERLAAQLAAVQGARLFLVKRPGEGRRDRVTVMYGRTPGRFRRLELATHGGLADLDLVAMLRDGDGPGEPVEHPLLLVCAHGIRDRCCAKYGQELCRTLNALAPDGWAWQTSHVGGDRFAGNLVVLPEGLYFGRVGREDAPRVLRSYLEGRIDLACYRGRSADPFPVQAADAAVRERTGLTGFHDLRVAGRERVGDGVSEVELVAEVSGETHRVRVERRLGEPQLLTCRAREPRPPWSFAVSFV
jgi:hypothetical protein